MTGKQLKLKLMKVGKSQKDIADILGVTAQSLSSVLSAKDVRSGTIEKIAQALCVPVSFFYEMPPGNMTTTGDNSPNISGNGNQVGANQGLIEKAMDTIADQQRTISTQTKLIARLVGGIGT